MTLSDAQIAGLVAERKPTVDHEALDAGQASVGHRRSTITVQGENGSSFRLFVRQLILDPLDFSVILGYDVPSSNRVFRLRRHNGSSHRHTNRLESQVVHGFHVHLATERYQLAGLKEDDYAEATTSYGDLAGAIHHMLEAAGFESPSQGRLL
jgi:hypothetical protein